MDNRFTENYHPLAREIINDIFYIQGLSYRGKVGLIRQYTEILVRSLFNIPNDEMVMLGDRKIKKALDELRKKSHFHTAVANAIEAIRDMGNIATHTVYSGNISERDLKITLFNLAKVYSCFFVDYFEKYPFGSNPVALAMFSTLPPKFRLLVLIHLHRKDRTNYIIAEKMIIALFKTRGIERMKLWVERNKAKLTEIKKYDVCNECDVENLIKTDYSAYDVALQKMALNVHPVPYRDFDKAAELYREYCSEIVLTNSAELMELKAIMDFVYLGVR